MRERTAHGRRAFGREVLVSSWSGVARGADSIGKCGRDRVDAFSSNTNSISHDHAQGGSYLSSWCRVRLRHQRALQRLAAPPPTVTTPRLSLLDCGTITTDKPEHYGLNRDEVKFHDFTWLVQKLEWDHMFGMTKWEAN